MPPGPARNAGSAQKSLGKLLEALIALLPGARKNARDVRMKTRLPPSISRRFLGIPRRAIASSLEENGRGSGVELGIVTGRKGEPADGPAAGVLVYESSGHDWLGKTAKMSDVRIQNSEFRNCRPRTREV